MKIGIVGAGIAGIATSIRLASKGHQVEVFEANAYPGGKLSEIRVGEFRFDAGPSLFTMPQLVEELFEIAGEDPRDYFQYIQLPTACHYFYEDGTRLQAPTDKEQLAQEVHRQTKEDPAHILKALNRSANLYDTLSDLFMKRSIHDWKTYVNKHAFRAYLRIAQLDFFRTMAQANKATFKDPRVVQLFNRYATYNGSDPYQTPATMNIIPHLEYNIGTFFPTKGMHSITLSLYELAKRKGVKFHFNQPVGRIAVNGGAKGLEIDGDLKTFDKVVSNMDVVNTYRKLLPDQKPPEFLLNQPKSSSALIFYWGIKQSFPQLDLHNIFFSADYEEEFKCIFQKGTIYHDPTVYVNITSKYKPGDAPKGMENWFTMINVPNNTGQDWNSLIPMARANILQKLSKRLGTDISKLIIAEDVLDPRTIESRTSSHQGALYGNSSNNLFAAFLRHANFSRRIRNLYFCGGSVHPGGGIPLCLYSAKIVSDVIDN